MFNTAHMSPTERRFVRTYVMALKRNFELLKSVMHLMNPAGLGVTDPLKATRVALKLLHMQMDFETELAVTPSLWSFIKPGTSDKPTLNELADLFSLSFFKIFTELSHGKFKAKKKDAGWFSGEPAEWHKLGKYLATTPNEMKSLPPQTFDKLLPKLELFKHYDQSVAPVEEPPLNFWPPVNPNNLNKKNPFESYDDDTDDYDDE